MEQHKALERARNMKDRTKKIPPAYHRRDVMLVTEVLILHVLDIEDLQTDYEIRKGISFIKHEGKREVQIAGPIKNLEAIGAIIRRTSQSSGASTFKITPKGLNMLHKAIDLMELFVQGD